MGLLMKINFFLPVLHGSHDPRGVDRLRAQETYLKPQRREGSRLLNEKCKKKGKGEGLVPM